MNSAPSSYHGLARDLDSIFSQSAPRPSNQNWPTPPTSNNQNWPTPPTSNKQNSGRRSIGKRISRAFARYSIVFVIGIGATLAWQSYRDEAMKMVRTEAPSLAWLLPVSKAKPPPDDQGSTTAAASSPQLERLELSLLVVRRSVEQLALMVEQLSAKQDQLAAKQDQLSHIATLKSVESPPQSRAVAPRKPPQPTARSSTVPPSPPSTD
jgi:hypothetical protein